EVVVPDVVLHFAVLRERPVVAENFGRVIRVGVERLAAAIADLEVLRAPIDDAVAASHRERGGARPKEKDREERVAPDHAKHPDTNTIRRDCARTREVLQRFFRESAYMPRMPARLRKISASTSGA